MLQSVPFAAPKTYLGIYNFKQTQTEVEFLCRFYSNKRTLEGKPVEEAGIAITF